MGRIYVYPAIDILKAQFRSKDIAHWRDECSYVYPGHQAYSRQGIIRTHHAKGPPVELPFHHHNLRV